VAEVLAWHGVEYPVRKGSHGSSHGLDAVGWIRRVALRSQVDMEPSVATVGSEACGSIRVSVS
jgi:hypothetical protein